MEFGNIPNGWRWTKIDEVTLPVEKVVPQDKPAFTFTYIDISSIDNSIQKIVKPKAYRSVEAPSRARQLVRANDILFSTVRTYLKNIALLPDIYDGQIASTGFSVLRTNEVVLPKYLFYYTLTDAFLEPLNELQRGTSYPAVRDGDVRTQPIPLPPLPEQERIVAKIEALFTQLDAGTAALRRIQAELKRYKASVLRTAITGGLSFKRLKDEVIPIEWKLFKLGSIFTVTIGGTPSRHRPEYWNGNIRWVSSGEVQNSIIKRTRELITNLGLQNSNAKLYPIGTVLLAMIGEGKTRGQAAILDIDASTNQNIAAILPNPEKAVPKWVFFWLLSRYEETRKSGSGGMQYALNSERIRGFEIPLPPLEEQLRLIAEVERRFSVVAEVEVAVEAALARSARLRQAILKRAFEGKLLDQRMEDAPVESLPQ